MGGHCDMLEVKINDGTRVGELTFDNINEWKRKITELVLDKGERESDFVKPLNRCTVTRGDGLEDAIFAAQTGSELKLRCKHCKLSKGNILRLETGAVGIVDQRDGTTVTITHRDFWSQQLLKQERSCFDQIPQLPSPAITEGCEGRDWYCCGTPSSPRRHACVHLGNLQHLAAGTSKDPCSFFNPSGVRSSNSVTEPFIAANCNWGGFDIGHWMLEKKIWKVKSMMWPSLQQADSTDPCSWVAGAVSRTKRSDANGDCKCNKYLQKVYCGMEQPVCGRQFFLADLQVMGSPCVNATNRHCK